MLTETFFTPADVTKIESSYKRVRKIALLILVIGIPVEILIGFLASMRKGGLHWLVAVVGIVILLFAYNFIFRKSLQSYKQDMNEQVKLIGELQVLSKSGKDKYKIINLDYPGLKNMVVSRDTYDKVNIGDILAIEISKNAKYVFKLSKEGEVIDK